MFRRVEGRVTEARELNEKASASMRRSPSGKTTFKRFLSSAKAPSPMLVTGFPANVAGTFTSAAWPQYAQTA